MCCGTLNVYTKPLELNKLLGKISELARQSERIPVAPSLPTDNIITTDAQIQRITQIVEKAASTDATVLITGESETGKELIAHALQKTSNRHDKPFIN